MTDWVLRFLDRHADRIIILWITALIYALCMLNVEPDPVFSAFLNAKDWIGARLNGDKHAEYFMGLCTVAGASLVIIAAAIQAHGTKGQVLWEITKHLRRENMDYLGWLINFRSVLTEEITKYTFALEYEKRRTVSDACTMEELSMLFSLDIDPVRIENSNLYLFSKLPLGAHTDISSINQQYVILKSNIIGLQTAPIGTLLPTPDGDMTRKQIYDCAIDILEYYCFMIVEFVRGLDGEIDKVMKRNKYLDGIMNKNASKTAETTDIL